MCFRINLQLSGITVNRNPNHKTNSNSLLFSIIRLALVKY